MRSVTPGFQMSGMGVPKAPALPALQHTQINNSYARVHSAPAPRVPSVKVSKAATAPAPGLRMPRQPQAPRIPLSNKDF